VKKLGLIGYPLSHSFSKKYFAEKFKREGIRGYEYDLYPLESIESLKDLLQKETSLVGLNVTIPYKQQVIPYLDALNDDAKSIGAVNTIKIVNGLLTGYNTDVYGFEYSLLDLIKQSKEQRAIANMKALILGTGGASKAVAYVLKKLNISYVFVSRSKTKVTLTYDEISPRIMDDHSIIINTTPLGMAPNVKSSPAIPYALLSRHHLFYDLVYNPEKTVFLEYAQNRGCPTKNGLEMLHLQAEKSWEIWTQA